MKSNHSERIWNSISFFVLLLLSGAEIRLMWQIRKLNMLPDNYFFALCGALLLVTGLLCLLLFRLRRGKWQKRVRHGKQILGYVLSILLLACCFVGSYVVGQVQDTIISITAPEKISVVLGVYVRETDEAQYVQDAVGYSFAVSEDVPEEDRQYILKELEALLGTGVDTKEYATTVEALDAMLAGETDAVILNSEYLSVLETLDGYAGVSEQIRMLHEYVFEKEVVRESDPELPLHTHVNVTNTPFLIYLSGNDALRPLLADGGSDVNILMLINVPNRQVLLVNTPRDYYVINPASGGEYRDKLSHCGLRGIENSISAVSGLYNIPIEYYARINFYGFKTLVDAIGGVTVYSDVSFQAMGHYIQEGENYLDGEKALAFARERKHLPGGDNDRGKNQMKLISAMINQLSVGNLVSNYSEILESLEGMFATNFPAADIGRLVQYQLTEMPSWEVLTFAVTGDNGTDHCWGVDGYGYVMYPHEHMVAHAMDLMERFLDGEKLTQEDMKVNP